MFDLAQRLLEAIGAASRDRIARGNGLAQDRRCLRRTPELEQCIRVARLDIAPVRPARVDVFVDHRVCRRQALRRRRVAVRDQVIGGRRDVHRHLGVPGIGPGQLDCQGWTRRRRQCQAEPAPTRGPVCGVLH